MLVRLLSQMLWLSELLLWEFYFSPKRKPWLLKTKTLTIVLYCFLFQFSITMELITQKQNDYLQSLSAQMSIFGSLVNPFVYCIMCAPYRRGYIYVIRKACTVCGCPKPERGTTIPITAAMAPSLQGTRSNRYNNFVVWKKGYDNNDNWRIEFSTEWIVILHWSKVEWVRAPSYQFHSSIYKYMN